MAKTVPSEHSGIERAVSRRDVLVGATVLASAATAGMARAAEHTGSHTEHKYTEAKRYKKNAKLVAATNECIAKGQACISHCMETFLADDSTMAECAFAVQQMLPVCNAMAYLAAYDSKNLKPMAQACIAVCEDCEKECRVHEKQQPECKACADACAALIQEARKVLA